MTENEPAPVECEHDWQFVEWCYYGDPDSIYGSDTYALYRCSHCEAER